MQNEMNANLLEHLNCKIMDQTHMADLMRKNENN